MPHDKNNVEVKPGDRVWIEAIVESVMVGVNYCNLTVKTVDPMPPTEYPTTIVLNTKQVRSVKP